MKRLNPFTAAPEGYAALGKVEDYIRKCGLEPRLVALVKTRVSQINGCAYCLHMHTQEALEAGELEVRLYLLDAWHESAMYSERERAARAQLGRDLDQHCANTRSRPCVRGGSTPVLRKGIGRSVDCDCYDQLLEPPCHRIASDASSGCHTTSIAD